MTEEKWQQTIGKIKDNFGLLDQRVEDLPEEAGRGTIEIVEFNGPLGRMKLERTTQPLVVDKKTTGSRRIGSYTDVSYIYSDTEKVHKFKVFRFDEGGQDWVEMKMERGEMMF